MRYHTLPLIAASLLAASTTLANTLGTYPVYQVVQSTDFSIGNSGASDYLFSWTDADLDTFTNEIDPTLVLTVGQTYTFQRTTGSHPFIIMDNSVAGFMTGTDGTYSRTTFSGSVLDAATLTPLTDFTADPAPTSDLITWTPGVGEVGTYWYTCRVTSHTGMTGQIQVVPEPSSFALLSGLAGLLFGMSRRRTKR